MSLLREMKLDKFFWILSFSAVVRLFFLPSSLWWDSSVYIGMAKYLFSFGSAGLWEPARPVFLPLIIGFFWRLFPSAIVFFSRLLSLAFSLASICLVYLIAGKYFNRQIAFFSSILFSFSSVFFFFTFRVYTEIPAVFFSLFALYLLIHHKPLLSGVFIGLAFLTKFPAGIFLVAFVLPLLLKKDIRSSAFIIAGFFIPLVPYFVFNHFMYGSFFFPLIQASRIIRQVVGCNILRPQPWFFYIVQILKDNLLNVFAVLGLVIIFKREDCTLLLSFLLPFLYFTYLPCRDVRYLILFIPFVSIFSAVGLVHIHSKFKFKSVFTFFVVFFSLFSAIDYYESDRYESDLPLGFTSYLADKDVYGEVWSFNPELAVYSDQLVIPVYYPLFTSAKVSYLSQNLDEPHYIFVDTCSGGMSCDPRDTTCSAGDFISSLEKAFNKSFYFSSGRCEFIVFVNETKSVV